MEKINSDGKVKKMVIELGNIDKDSLQLWGEEKHFYVNSLSRREMESLTSLCDTFLPSVDISSDVEDKDVLTFFQASASMAGTPERLGGLISERLEHPKKKLVRLTLWLLSTRTGSFILCGSASFTSRFPYIRSFPQLSQKEREDVVRSWSLSCFNLLRMLYKALKLLILFVFFTQVNEKNENSSWKAIGYKGPDPEFIKKKRQSKALIKNKNEGSTDEDKEEKEESDQEEELYGPLYNGLINMKLPREIVADSFQQFGFPVSVRQKRISAATSVNSPSLVFKCDAVVVGSGSGGSVIAGVLAKAGYKVLVLEKGNYYARANLSLLEGKTMDQMYLSSGLLATDDMGVILLAGSTVGGGSTINWSASIKTPEHVVNEWCEEYELELFDSKLYKEAMEVVCEKMGVQSEIDEEGFHNAVLRRGCKELGYPVNNIPRNSPSNHYCGWCCLGCKDGRKKGASETWLVDLVNSGNGAILPGCEAVKVLHKKMIGRNRDVATGVAFEFESKGMKEICIIESKVTIVACGALSTPALLKRSGLKNANIGKNLHLHPVTMGWGYFPEKYSEWPVEGTKSYEGGIMTAMSTVVADFDKSGYGAVLQTPALHPGMFSSLIPWTSGTDIKLRMRKYSRTAHIFALARDEGSGEVSSPHAISYQMEVTDEENLRKGLEKILRILAAAGAEEIGTHHFKGKTLNVKKASSDEFERFVKEESSRTLRDLCTPLSSAHQMGSCRMGRDPKTSVINQMGETWEVEGLYLADTSVFPTALGVNPMVTVQSIAYCTAQSVLEVLRKRKI